MARVRSSALIHQLLTVNGPMSQEDIGTTLNASADSVRFDLAQMLSAEEVSYDKLTKMWRAT